MNILLLIPYHSSFTKTQGALLTSTNKRNFCWSKWKIIFSYTAPDTTCRSRIMPYIIRFVTNLLATVASNVSVGHLSNFGKPTSTSHGPRLFQSSLVYRSCGNSWRRLGSIPQRDVSVLQQFKICLQIKNKCLQKQKNLNTIHEQVQV